MKMKMKMKKEMELVIRCLEWERKLVQQFLEQLKK